MSMTHKCVWSVFVGRCLIQENKDPEAVRRRAMQDPEIQQIIADPAMQLILQQMQKDPQALREYVSCYLSVSFLFGSVTVSVSHFPLPFSRHHLSSDDCLEVMRENNQSPEMLSAVLYRICAQCSCTYEQFLDLHVGFGLDSIFYFLLVLIISVLVALLH